MPQVPELVRCLKRGVPLFAVQAPDRIEALSPLTETALAVSRYPFSLDVLQGVRPLSESALSYWEELLPNLGVKPSSFVGQAGTAQLLSRWLASPELFAQSLWILQGANWFADDPSVSQGLLSLRPLLSKSDSAICLLDSSFSRLSGQLAGDCYRFSIPLPSPADVETIIEETARAFVVRDARTGEPTPETAHFDSIRESASFPLAVDSLLGISPFQVEQSVALAATKDGLDPKELLRKKRDSVKGVQGLTWLDPVPLSSVKGNQQAVSYLSSLLHGRSPYRVVVFVDEIDKTLGSSSGDTSGVSQALLGSTLTYLNDEEVSGCLLYGIPGTGKSLLCQAIASERGVPCLLLDYSRLKNSLVGKSEENLDRVFSVISSLAQGKGRVLFLATCNRIDGLPPELAARLSMGSFFFDFPEPETRAAIWEAHRVKWDLPAQPLPSDHDWVGRDIQKAVEVAARTERSLIEAAKFIVPTATQNRAAIEETRKAASGRFLSSSKPGVFTADQPPANPSAFASFATPIRSVSL